MIVTLDNEINFKYWADAHYSVEYGWDEDILAEEYVDVNPYKSAGVYTAIAIVHDPKKLTGPAFAKPSLVITGSPTQQISVWYTANPIFNAEEEVGTKSFNTYKMLLTALCYELEGVEIHRIPIPFDLEYSTHTLTFQIMKKQMSLHGKWNHHMHKSFGIKGGSVVSEKKSQTSSENFDSE